MKILIINGPNLNLLGQRQPHIYGRESWASYYDLLCQCMSRATLSCMQSNSEGEIIDALHSAAYGTDLERVDGVVLNAGAYTHYSYAIADAIEALDIPVIEVHISQPAAREEFRRKSVIAPVCKASVSGFGLDSYFLAIEGLLRNYQR
ncbi:MAG: 3-dehydroquinate dehydratase [Muribaculaceae bacterium]|nr:3-dehydroquinate dehydratase [Bacteroidales bacterium]MDE6242517.1 3-dehydroquinate dehydratase [Muribaculaceae bacterium]